MADNHTSSEEDDFCRISDGGQSDHEDEVTGQLDNPNQTQPSTPQISEYCQVVFQNVSESYKPGKPLECYYILSSILVPSQRDYIAVFKVGWNSVRSYMTFEYAPYPKNWKANQEFRQCVLFGKSYVPQEEDGEFYQFCYIDSAGKMRGASTPFQFLETPMDDYMEISDESLDILMIQTKKSHNSELVVKLTEERDNISAEKAQIEKEKNQLVGKVEELEAALSVKEEEVKEFTTKVESVQDALKRLPVVEGKLAATEKELGELLAEKKRYEESLQQTTEAFIEVQDNISQLEGERNKLKRELEDLVKERDEFKGQFASSEHENETLRVEIDNLKHQLMEVNEQNQIILAKEGAIKEEKQKVEQQLLVASSDQDHKQMLEAQVMELETSLRKSEERGNKLNVQIKAMGDFHVKLTEDYETTKIECDSLKSRLTRQADDFVQKQKRMEQHMALLKHQGNEQRDLLEEQVVALKEGIQKLAKEKENFVQGKMGSEEASHIAVKSFKDKVTKANRKAEEESRKRQQLQQELLQTKEAFQTEKDAYEKQVEHYRRRCAECDEESDQRVKDAGKEINSLKVRLEMAREEYKILYREVRSSENGRPKERRGEEVESPIRRESETVQSAPPPELDQSYESRDMTLNMEEMNRQLSQLTLQLEKRNKKITHYQTLYEEEKVKCRKSENLYKEMQETKRLNESEMRNKHREKQAEVNHWQGRFNKLHDDYLKTKHAYESAKLDKELIESVKGAALQPRPKDRSDSSSSSSSSSSPSRMIPRPPPRKYPNIPQPRQKDRSDSSSSPSSSPSRMEPRPPPLKFGNPYATTASEEYSLPVMSPPGKYHNPNPQNSSSERSIDIKNPPGNLPMPLQPQQTPQAKFLSVKASLQLDNKTGKGKGRTPTAPPMGPEEEDEDIYGAGCDEVRRGEQRFPTDVESDGVRSDPVRPPSPVFHDAQDFPAGSKTCEQCHMEFPPSISDEELAKHMQGHFTYECEECGWHADRETTSEQEFKRHRESHEIDEDLIQFCPVCQTIFKDSTPEQMVAHVNSHFAN